MVKTDKKYQDYVQILKEELVPAMGCTEPIAVAYCAALARRTLGEMPDDVIVEASGNIIKNVKSVVVPNTGHLRGIPAAAAAGIVAGDENRQLEVIASVTEAQQKEIKTYLQNTPIRVVLADTPLIFDIIVTVSKADHSAKVRIANYHTNVVLIEKDNQVLQACDVQSDGEEGLTDRSFMTVESILDFANTVEIEDVKPVLDVQIAYNMTIAEEGLRGDYGANIGKVLIQSNPVAGSGKTEEAIKLTAKAMAAAGSDARMNGCELPVCIISGSGNQGMTASIPIVIYAKELGKSEEEILKTINAGTREHTRILLPWNEYPADFREGLRQPINEEITKTYKELIALRHNDKALVYGDFEVLNKKKDRFVYSRTLNGTTYIVDCIRYTSKFP